jgi:hypothetical protein
VLATLVASTRRPWIWRVAQPVLGLPRPNDDDAAMRRFLGATVVAAVVAGAVIAALARSPASAPGYALNSGAIWRLEVFVVALVAIDIPISLIAGAFHGRMLTSLSAGPAGGGTAPITVPDPEQTSGIEEAGSAVKELRTTVEEGFKDLGARVTRLESSAGADAP